MKKAIYLLFIFLLFPKVSLATQNDLVISEIMYDWPSTDSGHEWVEIYNSGSEEVTVLTGNGGWRFYDGSNHVLNLFQGSEIIVPGQYFIIADNATQFLVDYPGFSGTIFDSSFSLNNTADQIGLTFEGGDSLAVLAEYQSAWGADGDGHTLEKINLSHDSSPTNWQASYVRGGTPGQPNSQPIDIPTDQLSAVATCPEILAVGESGIFDSQASLLPVGSTIDYLWDFGDQTTATTSSAEHSYSQAGSFQVLLELHAAELTSSDTCQVIVEAEVDQDDGHDIPPLQPSNHWRDIQLSEIMPNPEGSDSAEWIELYNKGNSQQDLAGFALQDNSTRVFTFGEQIIAPSQYLLIYKNQSGISLNNTGGDAVKLYSPDGELLDQVEYANTAGEGKSLARRENNFEWTVEPTPGKANIFPQNQSPQAVIRVVSKEFFVGEKIIFSAEDSDDPEEGRLTYDWDFGDEKNGDEVKENHIYEGAGIYQVKLTVTDEAGLAGTDSRSLEISDKDSEIVLSDVASVEFLTTDLILSEFLADPEGSDDGEWIELYNASSQKINLLGWQIDDQDGGSKPYTIKEEKIIQPQGFLVIEKSESKITLNNADDSVRIMTPLGQVWQEFSYAKVTTGRSWAWDFENQEWSEADPSPGSINKSANPSGQVMAAVELSSLSKNAAVIFQGIALQDTGTSSRSLYIADAGEEGWRVVEIYSSKKDWPSVVAGDVLEVSGTVSIIEPIVRIKISQSADIQVLGHRQPVEPDIYEAGEVDQEAIGKYIRVNGVVNKKNGKNVYLDSEEDQPVRIYYSGQSSDLSINKGDQVIASGILLPASNNLKLLVLSKKEIMSSKTVLGDKQSAEISQDQIKSDNSITKIDVSGKLKSARQVLIILSIILAITLGVFVIKKRLTSRP